ncbi:GAF domain-containing protein [Sorangium sp. So ce1128]
MQDVLQELFVPCWFLSPNNLAITLGMLVENTLRHGRSAHAIFGCINFGSLLCGRGDIELGYRVGRATIDLAERYPDKKSETVLLDMWGAWLQHWREGYPACKNSLLAAMHAGLDTGQYIWAFYSTKNCITNSLLRGLPLSDLLAEAQSYQPICKLDEANSITWTVGAVGQLAHQLSVETAHPAKLKGPWVDIDEVIEECRRIDNQGSLFFAHFFVVLHRVFQGAFEEAARTALSMDVELPAVAAWHGIPALHCYAGVALTQAADVVSPDERALFLARAEIFAEKLSRWADLCPENLAHRSALLGAEIERARGNAHAAADRYHEAIALAHRGGYLHDEALANELAGLSFRALGRTIVARAYLTEAHRAYGRWGAPCAMRRLERSYPDLVPSEILRGATCPEAAAPASTAFDLGSVLKASQAISGEILLPSLLEKLMQSILESAGARKGLVILRDNDGLVVQAEGHVEAQEIKVFSPVPLDSCGDVAVSVVHYVARTAESVVLSDAASSEQFASDPYLARTQARSILAAPILRQGRLVGVIYLENDLAAGAFTPDRLEVTRVLAAQVAISMENALLYASLEEKVRTRTAELEVAHEQIAIELSEKLALIARQKELIRTLSTPILEVWDGVLTIPVVGGLDDDRAATIMQDLLERVVHTQSRSTIIDLTGVDAIDPGTAERLVRIIRSVQLLGSRSVITGIQPEVARTMISHGLDLRRVATRAKLRDGLRMCMGQGN